MLYCKLFKDYKLPSPCGQFFCRWNIYSCLFTPNCTRNHVITCVKYIAYPLPTLILIAFLLSVAECSRPGTIGSRRNSCSSTSSSTCSGATWNCFWQSSLFEFFFFSGSQSLSIKCRFTWRKLREFICHNALKEYLTIGSTPAIVYLNYRKKLHENRFKCSSPLSWCKIEVALPNVVFFPRTPLLS